MTTEEFIKRAKEVHGDKYDYSLVEYTKPHQKVKIVCLKHGIFEQDPQSHLAGHDCKKCHYEHFNKSCKKLTLEEFIKRAKEVHGDKYDYSLVDYKNGQAKIKIICPKHGVFEQRPGNHMLGQGCPMCCGKNKTTEQFIKEAEEIYGDKYDYSLVDYKNSRTKIKLKCNLCNNVFEVIPHDFLSCHSYCNHYNVSSGETAIMDFLSKNNIKFARQKWFFDCRFIKPLPFDFFVEEKNLLIEYNGEQHYNSNNVWYKSRKDFLIRKHCDWLKRKYAKNNGFDLLIIPYWELKNINKILEEKVLG